MKWRTDITNSTPHPNDTDGNPRLLQTFNPSDSKSAIFSCADIKNGGRKWAAVQDYAEAMPLRNKHSIPKRASYLPWRELLVVLGVSLGFPVKDGLLVIYPFQIIEYHSFTSIICQPQPAITARQLDAYFATLSLLHGTIISC